MESPAGRAGAEDCHCESAARALWAGSDGRDAKGGHLRASENETGVWRKYLAGGAVRAVGQRAGRNRGAVTGGFAGDERWRVLGGSSRDASSDRASGDCAASRAEQERRDGVPGIRRERQGARDSCAIWVPGGGCWSGAAERTGKEVTRIAGYRTGISRIEKETHGSDVVVGEAGGLRGGNFVSAGHAAGVLAGVHEVALEILAGSDCSAAAGAAADGAGILRAGGD